MNYKNSIQFVNLILSMVILSSPRVSANNSLSNELDCMYAENFSHLNSYSTLYDDCNLQSDEYNSAFINGCNFFSWSNVPTNRVCSDLDLDPQIIGQCFIDANKNGRLDPTEELLVNVQLRIYKVLVKTDHNYLFGPPSEELLLEVKTDAKGEFVTFADFYPAKLVIYMEGGPYELVKQISYNEKDYGTTSGYPHMIINNKGKYLFPLIKK